MNDQGKLVSRIGEAINKALADSYELSDALEALREAKMEIQSLTLEITVQHMKYKVPVPVAASINWLEHLHKLRDNRESKM